MKNEDKTNMCPSLTHIQTCPAPNSSTLAGMCPENKRMDAPCSIDEHARFAAAFRIWCMVVISAFSTGCCGEHIENAVNLRIKLEDMERQHGQIQSRVSALEADIKSRENQVSELQGTQKLRRDRLVVIHKLEIAPFTKGRNFDGKPGDDGIKVYLNLLDAENDRIKQAGRTKIELFDLDAGARRLAEWDFDLDTTAKCWIAALGNYGYVFECPWQKERPQRSPLTVRVRFTDLLTGRTFEAQKPVEFELPPAAAAH